MDNISRPASVGNANWIAPLLVASIVLSVLAGANSIAIPIVGLRSALTGTLVGCVLASLFTFAVTSGEH
jgi:hypothetical protein